MSPPEIVVDPAFEGPPAAAQGGYACGLLARHLPNGAEVTLRRPVPLGAALRVEPRDGGLAAYDGQALVAEAAPARLDRDAPAPPPFAEALAATAAFPGFTAHPFPRCVVCGPERVDAEAFRVFPGPLAERELVAAVWYPNTAAVADGTVRSEFAWAALDCPAGWAALQYGKVDGAAVLGRMAAQLEEPVVADEAHIVVGWLDGVDGRKLHAGSALYSRSGVLQGRSRQTWIMVEAAR
jgi:hypothetical protein